MTTFFTELFACLAVCLVLECVRNWVVSHWR
jgi:hypothetical protein